MMGGVSSETCWASYKYGIINFDTLLRLVGFFSMDCSWPGFSIAVFHRLLHKSLRHHATLLYPYRPLS